MMSNRKRLFAKIAAGLVVVFGILFFPLRVRDVDRVNVVIRDANRLRDAKPVFLDWSYQPFYDAELIARRTPQWHVYSELGFNLDPLAGGGFVISTSDVLRNLNSENWHERNALLEITDMSSSDENATRGLRFYVHHGTMGGQGYRVYMYRCILGTLTRYSIEWVS